MPDEIPVFELKWEEDEMWVPKIMKLSGLCSSTGEAMRLIKQGGLQLMTINAITLTQNSKKVTIFLRQGRGNF